MVRIAPTLNTRSTDAPRASDSGITGIKVRCQCGAVLRVPSGSLGKSVACPKCQRKLRLPDKKISATTEPSSEPMIPGPNPPDLLVGPSHVSLQGNDVNARKIATSGHHRMHWPVRSRIIVVGVLISAFIVITTLASFFVQSKKPIPPATTSTSVAGRSDPVSSPATTEVAPLQSGSERQGTGESDDSSDDSRLKYPPEIPGAGLAMGLQFVPPSAADDLPRPTERRRGRSLPLVQDV